MYKYIKIDNEYMYIKIYTFLHIDTEKKMFSHAYIHNIDRYIYMMYITTYISVYIIYKYA